MVSKKNERISKAQNINHGDVILINGTIGDHGMAVMNARESFNFKIQVLSDCSSLNHFIHEVLEQTSTVKFMRDPTRGGIATVLNELAEKINKGIEIDESALPVNKGVNMMCELLGFDQLYLANEGKVLMVADKRESEHILKIMRKNSLGRDCAIIGRVVSDHPGKVALKTLAGGLRIVDSLMGDLLPRIC